MHGHGCMDDLTTERSFDPQATWVIDVLDVFHDMLSINVCATRHWQLFGRLVQALDGCTVHGQRTKLKYWPVTIDPTQTLFECNDG